MICWKNSSPVDDTIVLMSLNALLWLTKPQSGGIPLRNQVEIWKQIHQHRTETKPFRASNSQKQVISKDARKQDWFNWHCVIGSQLLLCMQSLAWHSTVTHWLATMCFPFRLDNIWFGKIQQAYIYSKYKAARLRPPALAMTCHGKWEDGVFKEERLVQTTSDTQQYIRVHWLCLNTKLGLRHIFIF